MNKNPLKLEDIYINSFIWYSGVTSISGWNCPARIWWVKDAGDDRLFKVQSLDDMQYQTQIYKFVNDTTESRLSMSPITTEEALLYLEKNALNYRELINDIKKDLNEKLKRYDRIQSMINDLSLAQEKSKADNEYIIAIDIGRHL